ncbi:hypothetical protein [Chryseolinea serpens]|nr:hypothetical protein [Chryseolinea serpens]
MNEFLRKIGLLDSFQIELSMNKSDFAKILIANLDDPGPDFFEEFSANNRVYKGTMKNDEFKIRRKRKYDHKTTSPSISGTLQQAGNKLIIDVELNGFSGWMIPPYIIMTVVYLSALSFFLFGDIAEDARGIALLVISIHAVFMFGGSYRRMKRSMRATKYDLERDLHFMMKDHVTHEEKV